MKALQPTFGFLAVLVIIFSCFSLSQALQNFVPVGCFKDNVYPNRALPDLIINHRTTHPVIDWSNLSITINSCAKTAQAEGYVYFALQFWGECWAGYSGHLTYDKYGPSTNCHHGVGRDSTNFVYRNAGKENECEAPNILDTEDRAINYSKNVIPHLCDDKMVAGWYRFKGKAGNDMANSCTAGASPRCGTQFTGWLKSVHSLPRDGIKPAKVCFHDSEEKNCCVENFVEQIKMRNCGRFYVYKLQPPGIGCYSRYCGNGRYI